MAAQDNSDDDDEEQANRTPLFERSSFCAFFSMCNRARVPIVPSKHMQLHPQTLQEGKKKNNFQSLQHTRRFMEKLNNFRSNAFN